MTTKLNGPRFGPTSGDEAQQLVILLHGRGADGDDLIGLAPLFAEALPHTAFVAPNAPQREPASFGYSWISGQDHDRHQEKFEAAVREVAPVLDTFIDAEIAAYGLADSRVALLGFSQGCMMALHVGLRRPNACAAILGYSGRLVAADSLAGEIASKPPVLLCHGTADPVVPFESLNVAAKAIAAAGVPLTTVERPGLGHSLDREGIDAGAALLVSALAGRGKAG